MAIASRMASLGDGKICPCKMRASKVCRKRVMNCTVVRASAKMCAVLSNGSGYMRPAVCIWCLKSTGPSATACTGTFAGLHCPLWAAFAQKQVVASGCHAISAGRGELPVIMGCLQPGPPIQSRSTFARTLDGFVHTRDTQPAGCNGHTALLWCELTDLTRIPYKVSAGIASSTIAVAAAQWCKPGCGLLRHTATHPDGLSSRQGRCGRLRNSQGDSMQTGWSN